MFTWRQNPETSAPSLSMELWFSVLKLLLFNYYPRHWQSPIMDSPLWEPQKILSLLSCWIKTHLSSVQVICRSPSNLLFFLFSISHSAFLGKTFEKRIAVKKVIFSVWQAYFWFWPTKTHSRQCYLKTWLLLQKKPNLEQWEQNTHLYFITLIPATC